MLVRIAEAAGLHSFPSLERGLHETARVISLLGTTLAAALPNGGFAQTPSRVYRLGLLSGGAPVSDASPYWAPLIRALAQQGYALDRNVVFERRGAEGASTACLASWKNWPRARSMSFSQLAIRRRSPSNKEPRSRQSPSRQATGRRRFGRQPCAAGQQHHRHLGCVGGAHAQTDGVAQADRARAAPRGDAVDTDDLGMTLRYRSSETGARAMGINVLAVGVREPDDLDRRSPQWIVRSRTPF